MFLISYILILKINKINYLIIYKIMEDRKNEVEIKDKPIKEVDINLCEVTKSICKIIYDNKCGTGFLIKLFKEEKELYCLMSNEHVITKDMIESNKIITVYYNYEKKMIKLKLDKNERYIKYNKDMDVTIIEILSEDNIKEKYFLLPDINNNINYINKDIYIPQYPEGKNLSYSEGNIINIDEYELIYNASTKSGSSGSPILLKNTTKVIGMHKQGSIRKTENYGTLINSIIQLLESENEIIKDKLINNQKKIYENGNYYIGQILNDKEYGQGKVCDKNGNIIYDGDFVNGKKEGNGKFIFEDGTYYIGQWLNDKMNGKGKLYTKNGELIYDGDFVNGKKEGNGKYIYENGEYYIGQWLNDKKHGKGILYYKNGNIKYDGEFVNDEYQKNCIIF